MPIALAASGHSRAQPAPVLGVAGLDRANSKAIIIKKNFPGQALRSKRLAPEKYLIFL